MMRHEARFREWATLYVDREMSLGQIGAQYGVSAVAVRRGLQKVGVERRPPGRRPVATEKHLRWAAEVAAGETMGAVGKRDGVSRAAVFQALQRLKGERRDRA